MTKFFTLFTPTHFLLVVIVLMTMFKSSRTTFSDKLSMSDMAADDNEVNLEEERRAYDYNQLRHFLLTANAEERALKREQQDFHKRQLVNRLIYARN